VEGVGDAQLKDCHLVSIASGWSLAGFEPFTGFRNQSSRLLSKLADRVASRLVFDCRPVNESARMSEI
jgi:predicted ester cyclase